MCSTSLLVATYIVFGIETCSICFFVASLQYLARKRRWWVVALPWVNLGLLTVLLSLHALSTCSRNFLTWGSILFAMYLCATCVDTCLYVVLPPSRSENKTEAADNRDQPHRTGTDVDYRTGTVLTVGRLAATVSESGTQRQYYADNADWGATLQPGDEVTFHEVASKMSGTHVVGSRSYVRHYCVPAGEIHEVTL